MEDLSKIESIAPHAGLAEVTTLAPERSASPLPSPMSELSSPGLPPNIIFSDNPMVNSSTVIPATDTLTTRPTAGGIAYPFSLKVDGLDGKDVNASTLTLASVNITTPPAVEDAQSEEKQLGSMGTVTESVNEQVLKEGRSGVERFSTAGQGAGLFSSGLPEERGEWDTVERPGVERFVTAQDGLGTLAAGSEK
jgi:hypothetical protein